MTTTYGTISSEAEKEEEEEQALNTKRLLVSKAKERIQTGLGTRRPWNQMIQPSHLTFPLSFLHSIQRIRTNSHVFRANYVIIILIILFLCLLWHPITLIMLILIMAAWLFLYFLRDDPLLILGHEIDERFVASALLLASICMIFLTNVTNNAMVGVSVGLGVALVHAIMRDTEDLFSVDEEEAVGDVVKLPISHASSSTFTLS